MAMPQPGTNATTPPSSRDATPPRVPAPGDTPTTEAADARRDASRTPRNVRKRQCAFRDGSGRVPARRGLLYAV